MLPTRLLHLPLLLACLAPLAAKAGLRVGEIGGSDIGFEGLLQVDANHFDNDVAALGGGDDWESGLRRAELVLKGKGPGKIDWVIGHDVHAEKWLDVNLRYAFAERHLLQLGQYKQPNSLEELSSTKNNDFISKAATTNAFAVARRLGVAYASSAQHWTFTASAFGRELTDGGAHGSGYGVRATFAPVQADGQLVHLGLSYVDHDTDADAIRLRARPQADLAAVRLVDTGVLVDSDRLATLGLEGVLARGPLKLQAEYMQAGVDRHGATADFDADGGYISAVYNLTGEPWGYKNGVPSTAKPASGQRGLWQAGMRYDRLDLDDSGVQGGRMEALTAGLNWYWGAHFKLMLNHVQVRSDRRGVADDPDIVEARLQFHW